MRKRPCRPYKEVETTERVRSYNDGATEVEASTTVKIKKCPLSKKKQAPKPEPTPTPTRTEVSADAYGVQVQDYTLGGAPPIEEFLACNDYDGVCCGDPAPLPPVIVCDEPSMFLV